MKTIGSTLLLFVLGLNLLFSQWRGYDVYRCGAKGIATGAAFTAVADDVSAVYFNPAGLIQTKKFSIFYTLDGQIKIITLLDTKMKLTYKVPALLGFVYPFEDKYHTTIAFAASSPFQRKIPLEFAVYKFAPVISSEIIRDLAVGFSPGLVYATYIGRSSSSDAWGFGYQFGLLYKLAKKSRLGLNYQSRIPVEWQGDITETFPDIITVGAATLLTEKLVGSFDLEYQNWKSAEYIENGLQLVPADNIKNGLFKTIHPHIGIMFLEEQTGAHIRTGFFTDSFIHADGSNETQFLWSFGVGAYAFSIVKIEAALVDSYIMHLFNDSNNRIETIQVTIEYQF
ncbi:MAG: hypothetical protein JW827_12575 [Spirochaetes bacterium]|nr:hypothetical protein [Spirochaetota bacterium]